jgi:FAD/FMN-containing dehydrogenase
MISRRSLLGAAALAFTRHAAPADVAGTPDISPDSALKDKVVYRGEARYETLRQAASWNARKPRRYPPAIVLPENETDIVAAVRLARARGWQVSVRSGGHSWTASHTRDGALQINLARMQELSYDPAAQIVRFTPSVHGDVLNKYLRDFGRMTTSAHGFAVGMGGFVMCGGHGYNSRSWGPACANLLALDLVNAQGDLIHADAEQNSDYFWAARGAGPGFFGVATRYYMKTYPVLTHTPGHRLEYGLEHIDALCDWLRSVSKVVPKNMEMSLVGMAPEGRPRLTLRVTAMCYGDAEARSALGWLEGNCPLWNQSVRRELFTPVPVPRYSEPANDVNPTGARFAVDGGWSNASAAELKSPMRRLFGNYLTPKSYVSWQCWGPVQQLPDMCYSIQGEVYLTSAAVYYEPNDDERMEQWAVNAMRAFDPLLVGAQMNDENMAHHPKRYLSEANAARLETLRAKYDPERRFAGFLLS